MDLKGKTIKNTYVPLRSFEIRGGSNDIVLYTFEKDKMTDSWRWQAEDYNSGIVNMVLNMNHALSIAATD